jgi:phosphatidylserine decarboxylase
MLTKYGYSTIGIVTAVSVFLFLLGFYQNNGLIKIILILVSILLLIFTLNFFRDPERVSPNKDNLVVSPADGTVLFVKEVDENKFIKGKSKQISIFMSPLNVHVNRIPLTGRVEYLQYHHGKYLAAFDDKASTLNERSEFGIQGKFGKVFFTQVAGFVARRIVYELKEGDSVHQGSRFGMIKFGSRVDVVVPFDWKEKVKKDDHVTAGETILFEMNK